MSSVRKRGNKCFTRSNKSGATYVVCNDPPKGSRGQAGVYQADNPTGKQDGRTKRKEAEIDKQRAFNRVRKSMMNKEYQGNFGGEKSTVDQRTPKSAPATSTMRKELLDKGTAPKFLDGMGRLYIYTRWANETTKGKKFIKDKDLEKPTEFAGVDDRDAIEDAAGDVLGDAREVDFDAKVIDRFPTRQEGYDYERGRMDTEERRSMDERTLRYKHYLELAGKSIPDWVKDISE
tara:strand:+ start:3350 stop:4048 length:699 start_codon:yes stop_codon:yes gene_type:complete